MQELKRERGDFNTAQLICNEIDELDQNACHAADVRAAQTGHFTC